MGGLAGNGGLGNQGTSANGSSHAEPSWRLNELTGGAVTIEKDDFLRRRRLRPCRTLKG